MKSPERGNAGRGPERGFAYRGPERGLSYRGLERAPAARLYLNVTMVTPESPSPNSPRRNC